MWVVVGIAADDMRLMGNWSSRKGAQPVTCLLVPADHPAISHDSYFVYGMMREFSEADLQKHIINRNFIPVGKLSEATLQKVQAGVFTDKKVAPYIKARYAHLKR